MIDKQPLVPGRIRRPPHGGWSWIDRRFLREFAAALSQDALLLYFFLAAVSDRHGLSFYGDTTMAARLRLGVEAVDRAREELIHRDLVAYRAPLVQVLSLPEPTLRRNSREAELLGDILRKIARHD